MMSGSFTILVRYILDPKEVHGEEFPGETFRVLKEKEVRLYGESRTSRGWCWNLGISWKDK